MEARGVDCLYATSAPRNFKAVAIYLSPLVIPHSVHTPFSRDTEWKEEDKSNMHPVKSVLTAY